MARATFEGPILAGTNRFVPFRNVGSVELVQEGAMTLTNTTAGSANYSGLSGQFVAPLQLYPNTNVTVYQPSASATVLTAQTIPADTTSQIYRGMVMYLPAGCSIQDIFVDIGVVPTVAAGSISSTQHSSRATGLWWTPLGTVRKSPCSRSTASSSNSIRSDPLTI